MGVQPDEKVLVVSDATKRKIGLNIFENALRLGFSSLYVEMKPGDVNGQEPPDAIAQLMSSFDVVFCPTKTSLTHTAARRNASQKGVRVATFPGITEEVMIRGLNADYIKICERSIRVLKVLERGKHIRITTKSGTDLEFSIEGRKVYASKGLFHAKGESGNLPTGETFLAPVEGSANGVFVVDGSMAGIGVIKKRPIKIEVRNGFAVKIEGGKQAKELQKMLEAVKDKGAFNIAEFGVGTNDKAKLSGVLLEDEKVMGTIHIALGNNKSMGGETDVPIHLDGVVTAPTVLMDGKPIMKKGKLLI